MSLDVYLKQKDVTPRPEGSGIFIREDGQTKEITRAEWDERYPNQEPVTALLSGDDSEAYHANITHNLNRMADAAGLYTALWRPAELLDPEKAALIREQEAAKSWHGEGGAYEIERGLPVVHARDLIEPLRAGLDLLWSDPKRFEVLNPENGWGNYDGLVRFVREYLEACEEYPEAVVEVSR